MRPKDMKQTATVKAVGRIPFEYGNYIPSRWYDTIRSLKTGKPDSIAIILLSEIVYWYRPTEVRSENGEPIRYERKFWADKLQMSSKALSDKFGYTKRQVMDALKRLEKDYRLIIREKRNVQTSTGLVLNAQYIDLNTDRLAIVTHNDVTTTHEETHDDTRNNADPYAKKRTTSNEETYPYIDNTQITSKTTKPIIPDFTKFGDDPRIEFIMTDPNFSACLQHTGHKTLRRDRLRILLAEIKKKHPTCNIDKLVADLSVFAGKKVGNIKDFYARARQFAISQHPQQQSGGNGTPRDYRRGAHACGGELTDEQAQIYADAETKIGDYTKKAGE